RLFHDPFLPRGYAPFNVAEIGNQVFVTYALQGPTGDDVAGAGHGFVDVFTNFGAFVHRFASRGVLNSPWGLAIAPNSFGSFAGDVLIGNFGDGRIHAFDPNTGHLRGTLVDAKHKPIAIDGLWGLIVGDAVAGGADSVWFSAGPDDESHGLLGVLRAG
ncbi:MAG TPA: TIGR03118 family protein, partial [Jatrophihabitantaceae bacterium]|nr:TIGR03118 family protein [Jatrophihabitantaceae bacterium]